MNASVSAHADGVAAQAGAALTGAAVLLAIALIVVLLVLVPATRTRTTAGVPREAAA